MNRLTIPDVQVLRSAYGHPSSIITSYKQFDAFKSSHSLSKKTSISLEHHFSIESLQFSGASLKKLATPGCELAAIPLGTGRPSADFFPWECISIQGQPSSDNPSHAEGEKTGAQVVLKHGGVFNLSSVLDYGHAAGAPQLLRFITEHVEIIHNPPYSDWGTCLSSGSTSAMEIALRIFCNRGDTILSEQYTYPGFIEVAGLMGLDINGVEMDASGIRPDFLQAILRDWDESQGRRPSVLYTIPSGQNPTGVTQTAQRKAAIYKLAEEYDLIIIEDDPYYFLQMESQVDGIPNKSTNSVENLIPSYVSLDKSGRVVRLDSASKIIAPGLRAGWVTANDSVIDKFLSYQEVCTAFVSGPAQLMLFKLLDETWGHQGFLDWLASLSLRYRKRRDIIVRACHNHLPSNLCSWTTPENGIFLWIKVDLSKHPFFVSHMADSQREEDIVLAIEQSILTRSLENGVQVTKGSLFKVPHKSKRETHFRMTFAAASESALETGVQIFAKVVKNEFGRREDSFYAGWDLLH